MNLPPFIELIASILVLASAFFLLVGAVGLARLPDFFMRLHAPTLSSTLGVGGIVLVSLLLQGAQGRVGLVELLITLFVFVTAPVSVNVMSQAALHLRVASQAPLPDDAVPERHPAA